MKKILLSVGLCMLVTFSFAQKKAVKEAKSSMDSKNFTEARTLIAPALTDAETATDPDTWKVAGDIENAAFEQERNNQIFQKDFNESVMYTALMNLYEPYIKADSLGQIPNDKGKVKNKYRKDIVSKMLANHPYYINGGVYYNEKKDYAKASQFFQKYWDIPSLEMFSEDPKDKINTNDSTFQTIKYYAAICAIQAEQHPKAIQLLKRINAEPFVDNSTYKPSDVYELLASEYQVTGDSVSYAQILEDGANKFPKNKFFMPNLINEYIKQGNTDKAIAYLDKAIGNDVDNSFSCDLISTKASLYANKKEYNEAFKAYEAALAKDPNCERALEGLAVSYIVRAQDIKEQAGTISSSKDRTVLDDQAKDLYTKSLPLLEKYKTLLAGRKADNSELSAAVYKLQNVYYNLNMNKEFDKATEELDKLSK